MTRDPFIKAIAKIYSVKPLSQFFFVNRWKLRAEGSQHFLNIVKNKRTFKKDHGIQFVLLKNIYPCVYDSQC